MMSVIGAPVWRLLSNMRESRDAPIEQLPWPMRIGVNAAFVATGVAALCVMWAGLDIVGLPDVSRTAIILPWLVALAVVLTTYLGISTASAARLILMLYGAAAALAVVLVALEILGFGGIVTGAGTWLVAMMSRPAVRRASEFAQAGVADLRTWSSEPSLGRDAGDRGGLRQ